MSGSLFNCTIQYEFNNNFYIYIYRKDNVLRLWNYLLELLRARRMRLELSLQLQQSFQEMIYIRDSMEELKMRLLSDDYGNSIKYFTK